MRLVLPLVHGRAILVGQVAEVRSFANVEAELERLALETQLLECVRAPIGAFLMSESFIADVVVVSDVVGFRLLVAWNWRGSRWRNSGWRFSWPLLWHQHFRLDSDSLLHGHLSVDFGEFDVIDIDDASASSQSVSSSPRRHRVAESDLLHPVDSGGVLVRSGLAPSDQSPVVVDEDSEVLMPTDLEQQQFPVLDLVGPSAPDVVLRLHDHFQPVVQPFGGHVV